MNSKPLYVQYTAVKAHRSAKRIWLEGRRLVDAGFLPGATYSVHQDETTGNLTMVLDPEGDRIVSQRRRRNSDKVDPIIDLCRKDLAPAGTRIRVVFHLGKIEASLHHEDLKQEEREERLKENVKNNDVKEGSMFFGIGVSAHATHHALKDAGIQSTMEWVVEKDGRYLQVAVDNNDAVSESTTLIEGSVEEVELEFVTPVDILSFSMPCNAHSKAGRAKLGVASGDEDPATLTALVGTLSGIRKANAAILTSENVVEARDSVVYEILKAELRRMGYVLFERTLDGEDAGTLEQRIRYYFVAVSAGLAEEFDFGGISRIPRIHATISDVLEPVPNDSKMWADNQYLKDKAIRDAEAGKGYAIRQLLNPTASRVGTIGKYYAKRRSTEPFLVREDGKERLFTLKEAAAMKRIPPHLVDGAGLVVGHEGLGQSVLYTHILQIMQPVVNLLKGFRTCENPSV